MQKILLRVTSNDFNEELIIVNGSYIECYARIGFPYCSKVLHLSKSEDFEDYITVFTHDSIEFSKNVLFFERECEEGLEFGLFTLFDENAEERICEEFVKNIASLSEKHGHIKESNQKSLLESLL